jgi:hypothetical protein
VQVERNHCGTPPADPSSGGDLVISGVWWRSGWVSATLDERKMNERRPMNDSKMTTGLAQTWIVVTDLQGRTHLEARWTETPHDHAPVHATTHAA